MWWMKRLKFSNGYVVGLRLSVNMMTGKLIGLKRHDYHIIMERLMSIIFQGNLNNAVWMVLAELRYFYRQLCAKEIMVEMMEKLKKEIKVLVCNMEKKISSRVFQSNATSPYTSSI
jgi:hypothetical protein